MPEPVPPTPPTAAGLLERTWETFTAEDGFPATRQKDGSALLAMLRAAVPGSGPLVVADDEEGTMTRAVAVVVPELAKVLRGCAERVDPVSAQALEALAVALTDGSMWAHPPADYDPSGRVKGDKG